MRLTLEQLEQWDRDGFFILERFAVADELAAMHRRVVEIAREIDAGTQRPDLIVQAESRLADAELAEERLSKVFRMMRTEPVFNTFARRPDLLAVLAELIGTDIDCFLSQFIFKYPHALGQPWHQDNFYFQLTPAPQIGVWLACSEATLENGPLWVVPGSHREHIHGVVPDPRPESNKSYVEIVTADTTNEQVVLMEPGDLLVFHSHLRHRSTDNNSSATRTAMVYHFARADSVGDRQFNQDWTEVLRNGAPVSASTEPVPVS